MHSNKQRIGIFFTVGVTVQLKWHNLTRRDIIGKLIILVAD